VKAQWSPGSRRRTERWQPAGDAAASAVSNEYDSRSLALFRASHTHAGRLPAFHAPQTSGVMRRIAAVVPSAANLK